VPSDRVQKVIKALGSPVRREILWRVWDRERTVGDIADGLGVTAPTLSGHLTVLRDAGLIRVRPDGTTRWYVAQRDAVAGFRGLLDDAHKWGKGKEHPEQSHATSDVQSVVVVSANANASPSSVFRGFTDPRIFAHCIGGEVAIEESQFRAALPFGPVVRGLYLQACAPALIIMAWDFEDGDVPLPGNLHRALLVLTPNTNSGCTMEITQFISSPSQEQYMRLAWTYVLGCFAERIEEALQRFPS
jgi:DNA-binding transcriptional ArsR family regulator/uncharacterized protein YndB with AHSA1/START domain